jgi:hypothetical protein
MINVLAAKFNQVDASIADTSVSNRRAPNQTFVSSADYRQQLLSVEQACLLGARTSQYSVDDVAPR